METFTHITADVLREAPKLAVFKSQKIATIIDEMDPSTCTQVFSSIGCGIVHLPEDTKTLIKRNKTSLRHLNISLA